MANLHGSIDPVAWQNPLHPDQLSSKPIPNWMPLYTAAPVAQQQGEVVVTWDEQRTRILAVTRQDEEGRVLSVVAEAPAQQSQAEAVPPTHVLVPVEPTPEMIQGFWGEITHGEPEREAAKEAWRKAIDAAIAAQGAKT